LPEGLLSGQRLARNVVLNLAGQGLPVAVAIFAIPVLLRQLGIDRFGVMTLVWMVIGYLSLFDLGTGRALTKFVAQKYGTGDEQDIPALVWTSLAMMLGFGLVGTVGVLAFSPWLVRQVLNVPPGLHSETLASFHVLALSIPVVITTTGLRGVLEARQRFGFINAVSVVNGIFSFAAPLVVVAFSRNLLPIVAVLAVARLVVLVIHFYVCLHEVPSLSHRVAVQPRVAIPLLRFGGWITVSNVLSPIMVYADRLLVAALVSIAAVAYYVTPYSLVTKLLLVPTAIAGVLFPAFAATFSRDRSRTSLLFSRGVKSTLIAVFPLTLLVVALAHPGLSLWLGADFAAHGARVLQILAIGVFINSIAHVPFALVQGAGRADLAAKLHLAELPVYLAAVWLMTRAYGIEGTALAWSIRAAVDAILLFWLARRVLPQDRAAMQRLERPVALAGGVQVAAMAPRGLVADIVFAGLVILVFGWLSWMVLLDPEERTWLRSVFRTLFRRKDAEGQPGQRRDVQAP